MALPSEHRPEEVAGRRYWRPSGHGADVEGGAPGDAARARDDNKNG